MNNPLAFIDPLGLAPGGCQDDMGPGRNPCNDGGNYNCISIDGGQCVPAGLAFGSASSTLSGSFNMSTSLILSAIEGQWAWDNTSVNPTGTWTFYPADSDGGNSGWLNDAWNYLKSVPVNLTVIVPVIGRFVGPAVTITYLPQTKNLCVAPGLGASIGRNVSAGPLVLGNLANAQSITEGPSISVGAQVTPLLGAQATGNQNGILGGPTVGGPAPGGSVTATYGICF